MLPSRSPQAGTKSTAATLIGAATARLTTALMHAIMNRGDFIVMTVIRDHVILNNIT